MLQLLWLYEVYGKRRTLTAGSKYLPDFLYFLDKGVAVIKGGPGEPAVFESQGNSALTRQVVSMACEVRSRNDTGHVMHTNWR